MPRDSLYVIEFVINSTQLPLSGDILTQTIRSSPNFNVVAISSSEKSYFWFKKNAKKHY